MRREVVAICVLLAAGMASGQFGESPFSVSANLDDGASPPLLLVTFSIPEDHYLYADQISVRASGGARIEPRDVPLPKRKNDPFAGGEVSVYDHDITFTYVLPGQGAPAGGSIVVSYQGCDSKICFLPQVEKLSIGAGDATTSSKPTDESADLEDSWRGALEGEFRVAGRAAGYVRPDEFIAFLEKAKSGAGPEADHLTVVFRSQGIWVAIGLILMGGLLLNLTPCVLPMIPVNLAIIGAGAQAGSRGRGFALGGAYGGGIALVYGLLGLGVMLTGSKFGTFNASPWFNLCIAVVFAVMALAMFDVIHVDFSRLQSRSGPAGQRRGGFFTALLLGGVAALLAGACVAPVVISVLLLSSDLYARGQRVGLFLPFLLGLGMALPWPFAGAGMSFLPKPGKWMERVKVVFGIVILLMAGYYGRLGITLFVARSEGSRSAVAEAQAEAHQKGWLTSLDEALSQAALSGQPVFIDFWASWCKNCLKMEKTTFMDPDVTGALEPFVRVKLRAEDIGSPETKALLDTFGVVGLPTYVVLMPNRQAEDSSDE